MKQISWLLALGLFAFADSAEAAVCSCYKALSKTIVFPAIEYVLEPTACDMTPPNHGWVQVWGPSSSPPYSLWLAVPNGFVTNCEQVMYMGERGNGLPPIVQEWTILQSECKPKTFPSEPPDRWTYTCGPTLVIRDYGEELTCSVARFEAEQAAEARAEDSCIYGICSSSSKQVSCKALGPNRTDGFRSVIDYTYSCNVNPQNACQ